MKTIIALVLLVVVAGAVGFQYWRTAGEGPSTFRKVPVKRSDLLATISATGTIEPEEVVDIGAQVAGKIDLFGRDPKDQTKAVDYGTAVEKGTVLAHIDEALYAADADQSRAQLGQAQANVTRAQADLLQLQAKLYQADQDWQRAQKLEPSVAISKADYDMFQANFKTAKANLAVGEAAVVQAQKAVVQAEAGLKRAETNLGYCTIQSPVKGVIVDRRVNIGQTVVAALNAPSLFLIAKDLKRLQVWASVNEADIGQIHKDQAVTFTVDAFADRVFQGKVGKVRLNATMTQNVVTYTVEINTDNADEKLLPYMTANVQFEVSRHAKVLVVPNTALRWLPQLTQVQPAARQEFLQSARRKDNPNNPSAQDKDKEKQSRNNGMVWVEEDGYVRPLRVRFGSSDGTLTEIQGADINEGTEVVIGEVRNGGSEQTTNPFAPQLFGGRKSQ